MNSLSDPSTADVTGRVLEAFGLLLLAGESPHHHHHHHHRISQDLSARVRSACARAIAYLSSEQEASGSWYGRWGSNYIYGTSNVLCGLEYFCSSSSSSVSSSASDNDDDGDDDEDENSNLNLLVQSLVNPAIRWLKSKQNPDGGWGESLYSYKDKQLAGCRPSTPSQTAWGLMALLAHLPPTDEAIRKGIAYLILTQTVRKGEGDGAATGVASWPEPVYTGTGFPGFFYLGYALYAHYFPLMRSVGSSVHVRPCMTKRNHQAALSFLPPPTATTTPRTRDKITLDQDEMDSVSSSSFKKSMCPSTRHNLWKGKKVKNSLRSARRRHPGQKKNNIEPITPRDICRLGPKRKRRPSRTISQKNGKNPGKGWESSIKVG